MFSPLFSFPRAALLLEFTVEDHKSNGAAASVLYTPSFQVQKQTYFWFDILILGIQSIDLYMEPVRGGTETLLWKGDTVLGGAWVTHQVLVPSTEMRMLMYFSIRTLKTSGLVVVFRNMRLEVQEKRDHEGGTRVYIVCLKDGIIYTFPVICYKIIISFPDCASYISVHKVS